jgi:competence ComEA-like helix-hairpin-helix protein
MSMKVPLFSILALVCLIPAAKAQDDLPEGKGKDVTARMCSSCHGLSTVTASRRTGKSWARTVDDMVGRGAEGTDDEIDLVTSYLSAHFGTPVNINKASAKEIADGLSLPSKEADALVKYRQDHGNFKELKDLTAVPGVNAVKVEEQSANIAFGPA